MPNNAPVTNYDVHPDGRSFVFVRFPADEDATGAEPSSGPPRLEIEVVVNWFEELRQLSGEAADGR